MDIPFRGRGRPTPEQRAREVQFADELMTLDRSIDFKISARGWCYYLEGQNLADMSKADFDRAEDLINSLREDGVLPIDFVANSQQRIVEGLEQVSDQKTVEGFVDHLRDEALPVYASMWTPSSQWEDQHIYVELVVEKIDLVGLFLPVCEEFGITITNMQGWSDPLTRATQMLRFISHDSAGRSPIVLYITDHDPDGLRIADFLGSHYDRLSNVRWMGGREFAWTPDLVRVERIGLDYEMIERFGLTWIDGLTTGRKNADGSKRDLSDPNHRNHDQTYVQEYLKKYGARKVEANALVARIDEARQWLRGLLPRYVNVDALRDYREDMKKRREDFLTRADLTLRKGRK